MNRLKIEEIKRRRYHDRKEKTHTAISHSPIERPIAYILEKQKQMMQHEKVDDDRHKSRDSNLDHYLSHSHSYRKSKGDRVSLSILPAGHKASKMVKQDGFALTKGADLPQSKASGGVEIGNQDRVFGEAVTIISSWMTQEAAFIDPTTAYDAGSKTYYEQVTNRLRVFKAKINSTVMELLVLATNTCQQTPKNASEMRLQSRPGSSMISCHTAVSSTPMLETSIQPSRTVRQANSFNLSEMTHQAVHFDQVVVEHNTSKRTITDNQNQPNECQHNISMSSDLQGHFGIIATSSTSGCIRRSPSNVHPLPPRLPLTRLHTLSSRGQQQLLHFPVSSRQPLYESHSPLLTYVHSPMLVARRRVDNVEGATDIFNHEVGWGGPREHVFFQTRSQHPMDCRRPNEIVAGYEQYENFRKQPVTQRRLHETSFYFDRPELSSLRPMNPASSTERKLLNHFNPPQKKDEEDISLPVAVRHPIWDTPDPLKTSTNLFMFD